MSKHCRTIQARGPLYDVLVYDSRHALQWIAFHYLSMCNVGVCDGNRSFVGIFPVKVICNECACKENEEERTRPVERRALDVIGSGPECPEELIGHYHLEFKFKGGDHATHRPARVRQSNDIDSHPGSPK